MNHTWVDSAAAVIDCCTWDDTFAGSTISTSLLLLLFAGSSCLLSSCAIWSPSKKAKKRLVKKEILIFLKYQLQQIFHRHELHLFSLNKNKIQIIFSFRKVNFLCVTFGFHDDLIESIRFCFGFSLLLSSQRYIQQQTKILITFHNQ